MLAEYITLVIIAIVVLGMGAFLWAMMSKIILKRRFKKNESKYRQQFRTRKDGTIQSIATGVFGSSQSRSNEPSTSYYSGPNYAINPGPKQDLGTTSNSLGKNSKLWFLNKR